MRRLLAAVAYETVKTEVDLGVVDISITEYLLANPTTGPRRAIQPISHRNGTIEFPGAALASNSERKLFLSGLYVPILRVQAAVSPCPWIMQERKPSKARLVDKHRWWAPSFSYPSPQTHQTMDDSSCASKGVSKNTLIRGIACRFWHTIR